MNKTAIKNFAVWARNKLISDISYKAGLLGVTDKEIKSPLPQSTQMVQFFEIGTKEPFSITGAEIEQRKKLVDEIQGKANQSDYKTAYKNVVEEVAYTWFNRLIAVRFMEVNDYLPTHIRVLSSESSSKTEPDLVSHPLDADLNYTPYEKDRIMQLKNDNKLDDLFRMLFIKQCNNLNTILPELFEKTNDYTELLLNLSFTDQDSVIFHLVHDISEDDFDVSKEGQVEIIGWMYQYYNTEPKDETFALLKKNVKITKERIPTATQLFTPDWIVHYMVENSLGRLWLDGHQNNNLKSEWKYYLDAADQFTDLQTQLNTIREEYSEIKPENIKVIDPCMGSGHILVYAFDVLMQIYESCGYNQRDATQSIIENNLYGLDIDNRAYQLAYFAVMMKARQFSRHIFTVDTHCNIYAIKESNSINRSQLKYFGIRMLASERTVSISQIQYLLDSMVDAKVYGSILNMKSLDWFLLRRFVTDSYEIGQMTLDSIDLEETKEKLLQLIQIAEVMANKYDVVVTNPPYMGANGMNPQLCELIKREFSHYKSDLFSAFIVRCMDYAKQNGYLGFMTPFVWMFIQAYEKLRLFIIDNGFITSLIQFEYSAFDEATVPLCSFTMQNCQSNKQGSFLRLTDFRGGMEVQRKKVLEAIEDKQCEYFYKTCTTSFSKIPGSPIAYWVSSTLIGAFDRGNLLGQISEPKCGLSTTDNNRFLRLWFEPSFEQIDFGHVKNTTSNKKFFPYSKGGEFRRWYGNQSYVVNWENDGAEIKKVAIGASGGRIVNPELYFDDYITWTKITSSLFSMRYFPSGTIFSDAGGCIFSKDDMFLLAFTNSNVCQSYLNILNPTMNYQVGNVANLPIVNNDKYKNTIIQIAKNNVDISKIDWDSYEISWKFKRHPLLRNIVKIESAFDQWKIETEDRFNMLKKNEEELNQIFINIYGLQDELTSEVQDRNVTIRKADLERDIHSFISYAVGCMFGRYSLDVDGLVYAGGTWNESKYSTFIPDKDNILPIMDEEYFEDDIVSLFYDFLKKSFGVEKLEENFDFIAKALGNKGNNSREVIRNYFLKDFFKDHCKSYQNRPIYWLYDSGKADSFKALIYMHRYNVNTVGNMRIDYLHRMQRIYENEISRMQETIENSRDTREVTTATKRKEKLVKQLKETKEYDEKVAHLALARIEIDLDDGMKINYEKVQTGVDGKKLDVLAKIQ